MVQTTNPKGAAKAEVGRIIPWLQVRILPVLLSSSKPVSAPPGHRAVRPQIEIEVQVCLADAGLQLALPMVALGHELGFFPELLVWIIVATGKRFLAR